MVSIAQGKFSSSRSAKKSRPSAGTGRKNGSKIVVICLCSVAAAVLLAAIGCLWYFFGMNRDNGLIFNNITAAGINLGGMTPEQAHYNRYAPILMTSVDTDPNLCAAERAAILQRLGVGDWQIFGAHGAKKEYHIGLQA